MSLTSMTGFARIDGAFETTRFAWEIRSVNGRGLDLRLRMPPGFEAVEQAVRAKIGTRVVRGSLQASLQVERSGEATGYRVNRDLLDLLIATARDYAGTPGLAPASLDGLLAVKGVVEPAAGEEDAGREALEAAVVAAFEAALDALVAARLEEGRALTRIVGGQIDEIARLAAEAEACPARRPEAIAARLAAQVEALTGRTDLDPARLHQEAMLLAARADIREELDRLTAHVAQARKLVAEGRGVGRRLDFLAQEFNRETNTLCSKSNDAALTAIGLALKAVIDQFKEQVQNIE